MNPHSQVILGVVLCVVGFVMVVVGLGGKTHHKSERRQAEHDLADLREELEREGMRR
jgi:hypothetical protein